MSVRLPTFLTITGISAAASFFMGKIASQKQIAACNTRLADQDAQIKKLSQSIREEQELTQRFIRIGSPIKGAASIGKNLNNLKVCRFEDPSYRMLTEFHPTLPFGLEQLAYDTGKRLGDCIDEFFKEIAQKGAIIAPAGIFEGGFPKEDTVYINYSPRARYKNWVPISSYEQGKPDLEEMVQLSTTEPLRNHSNTGNKPKDNSSYNNSAHHSRSSDDDDDS